MALRRPRRRGSVESWKPVGAPRAPSAPRAKALPGPRDRSWAYPYGRGSPLNKRGNWQQLGPKPPTRDKLKDIGPKAPGVPQPPSPAPAPAAAPDPRDATYWNNMAKLRFQAGQGLNEVSTNQRYAEEDFTEALRRRTQQRSEDLPKINEGANTEGLLHSGQLGKRRGEYEADFTQQTGDLKLSHERESAARHAARQAIEAGLSIDEAGEFASTVSRQVEADISGGVGATPTGGEEEGGGLLKGNNLQNYIQSLLKPPKKKPKPKGKGGGGGGKPKPKKKPKPKPKKRR